MSDNQEEQPQEYIYDAGADEAFVPLEPIDEYAQFYEYRTKETVAAQRFDSTKPVEQWPKGVRLRSIRSLSSEPVPAILTLSGWVAVDHGDYVVMDGNKIYPVTAPEFHKNYELVRHDTLSTEKLEQAEAEEQAAIDELLRDLMEDEDSLDPDAQIDVQEKDFGVLKQLTSATRERDVLNKTGRDRLVAKGYAQTLHGWSFLTAKGIALCLRLRFLRS